MIGMNRVDANTHLKGAVAKSVDKVCSLPVLEVLVQENDPLDRDSRRHVGNGHRTDAGVQLIRVGHCKEGRYTKILHFK